ncbi:MAG TPA: sigma-70 family RNA polymerase sigma factor [Gemmataceae bacterium]|jgi:RNA polymerase sigma factor (sigma-70 family)
MATGLNKVLDHLQRTLVPPDGGLTDGQLLARFVASRDEASFAALVRRHGPMVWRLCLRLLGHAQDAEDTFQATFLVLACKAASVLKRESVGSFLYGVAHRTALDARTVRARRRAREKQGEQMPHPVLMPAEPQDWRPWLDHELSRLPEKYRTAVILCDLEGRSRKEAARQLKMPEGTLSSRLATARRMLAKRLARYGLSLSGGALAAILSDGASAALPAALTTATVKASVLAAAGEWSSVSGSVAILMKGALKTMFVAKLKLAVGAVMVLAALGASGLVYRAAGQSAAPQKRPLSEVETLRRENELLKLNLEVVLEKVRAQEAELRTLRAESKGKPKDEERVRLRLDEEKLWAEAIEAAKLQRQHGIRSLQELAGKAKLEGELAEWAKKRSDHLSTADLLKAAEDRIKALQKAPDPDSVRRHVAELEALLSKLRERQQKPQPTPNPQAK